MKKKFIAAAAIALALGLASCETTTSSSSAPDSSAQESSETGSSGTSSSEDSESIEESSSEDTPTEIDVTVEELRELLLAQAARPVVSRTLTTNSENAYDGAETTVSVGTNASLESLETVTTTTSSGTATTKYYDAIIGDVYYSIDTSKYGNASRQKILAGDSEIEFSEAVAQQMLSLAQAETMLSGVLAYDEALAALEPVEDADNLHLELTAIKTGEKVEYTLEGYYENLEAESWEYLEAYFLIATVDNGDLTSFESEVRKANPDDWDYETHAPSVDAPANKTIYELSDIEYAEEQLPATDPEAPIFDVSPYFISTINSASLDMSEAVDGAFKVGDTVWLNEVKDYLPTTAKDASTIEITSVIDTATGEEAPDAIGAGAYGFGQAWAKPGTFDVVIGNEFLPDLYVIEDIVVTGSATTGDAPIITGILDDYGTLLTPDDGTTNEYTIDVPLYDIAMLMPYWDGFDTATQAQLDAIDYTVTPANSLMVYLYLDGSMPYMEIMGMKAGTNDLTINNHDGSTIVLHCVVAAA